MRKMSRALVLVLPLIVLAVWFYSTWSGPRIKDGSVLTLDLRGRYVEDQASPLLARLTGRGEVPLVAVLSRLSTAERDPRLYAVVLRVGDLDIGWGKAQELRGAIQRLREAGRRPVAYLEVESFAANLEYYVASAAERVVMAPGARGAVVGLAGEYFFLGGVWQKLGVEIEIERAGAYKSAVDFFTGRRMSEAYREMANWLLDSIEEQFVADIAESRELSTEQVRAAIRGAPVAAEGLRALKLIDEVAYHREVVTSLGEHPLVKEEDYARVSPRSVGFDPVAHVALIYGSGTVVTGEGGHSPSGRSVFAADSVSRALEEAAEDEDIDAIVLRIDSPGGSAMASDLLWGAVQHARGKKPVVASFSDVAASGGYYVASAADAIVALPGSVTGSIGAFVLRPVISGLLDKLGIGYETLLRSPHAEIATATRKLSRGERERLRQDLEGVYALFVERVAEGRDIPKEQVDAVGQGRVWTGAQAAEHGLVDSLGGLRAAVAEVRKALELPEEADVALLPYPPPASLAEQLAELLQGTASALGMHRSSSLRAVAALGMHRLLLPAELEEFFAWLLPPAGDRPVLLPPIAVRIR